MESRLPPLEPTLDAPTGSARWKLALAAVVFTFVAVYGSFVPMEFKQLTWAKAVEQFKQVQYLDLGLYKRADFVANILLFVPLGFFWLGAVDWGRRSRVPAVVATPFILGALVALAFAIEFAQQWTVRRTVSQNDIIAECVGAAIGVALWFIAGHWLVGRMRDVTAPGRPVASPAEQTTVFVHRLRRFLLLYALGLVLYDIQPLDIAISAEAIREKMGKGWIVLAPFSKLRGNVVGGVWQALSDVVLFIPIGVLLRLGKRQLRAPLFTVLLALIAASLIELMQLFIFSRIVDTTDIVTSTIGGAVGAYLAVWLVRPSTDDRFEGMTAARLATSLGLVILYTIPLLILFWHPHRLVASAAEFRVKLQGLWGLPFSSHYFGSEYHALVDVVRDVMYFVPIGALIRWAWRGSNDSLGIGRAVVVLGSMVLATTIEVGQAAIVGRYADITDLCLNVLGACLGWWVWGLVFQRAPLAVALGRSVAPERTY